MTPTLPHKSIQCQPQYHTVQLCNSGLQRHKIVPNVIAHPSTVDVPTVRAYDRSLVRVTNRNRFTSHESHRVVVLRKFTDSDRRSPSVWQLLIHFAQSTKTGTVTKARSTPATMPKQHCRMLQCQMLLRQSRTLLRHCCPKRQHCRSNRHSGAERQSARKSKTKNGRLASLASNPWINIAILGTLS